MICYALLPTEPAIAAAESVGSIGQTTARATSSADQLFDALIFHLAFAFFQQTKTLTVHECRPRLELMNCRPTSCRSKLREQLSAD